MGAAADGQNAPALHNFSVFGPLTFGCDLHLKRMFASFRFPKLAFSSA